MKTLVQDAQAPLRSLFRTTPALAMVTDNARTCGADPADPFHSSVEPMDGCGVVVPVGVHRAVGGLHDAPTPGDILCAALASCQDSSVRMVANRLGVEILSLEVRVNAKVDVRGTLGMDADVPVGFQSISCDIDMQVKEDTPPKLREVLKSAAQKCCVVQQTLHNPPPVMTRFVFTDMEAA
ncbi:MAG: OsmC family protein [Rhizobacter sp.]|nr:OsmC family protein [Burkholderiales bacterium]